MSQNKDIAYEMLIKQSSCKLHIWDEISRMGETVTKKRVILDM